eukprot:scaffold111353_cov19-Tisochrysis_lutea.AAC.3
MQADLSPHASRLLVYFAHFACKQVSPQGALELRTIPQNPKKLTRALNLLPWMFAVSFAMPFVLITSLLGYYSLWFGPQILLELTLAFYVPSIPVLIILGQR